MIIWTSNNHTCRDLSLLTILSGIVEVSLLLPPWWAATDGVEYDADAEVTVSS